MCQKCSSTRLESCVVLSQALLEPGEAVEAVPGRQASDASSQVPENNHICS